MKPAPEKIADARVICFAVVNSLVQPTGNCRQIISGVLQGPAAGMAICQYEGGSGFYLFGCDWDWKDVTDSWHGTLQEAKEQAEFEYAGISAVWQTAE